MLLALLLLGGTVRGVYLWQISRSPLLWTHRGVESDMYVFHSWAKHVADGDIWSRSFVVPLHRWRLEIADAFLAKHPDEQASLDPAKTLSREALARKLWDRWCPPLIFYQEPLYPYFVAAIFAVCGDHPLAVFIVQSALGLAGVILIYAIGNRLFGETVGLLSALLMIGAPTLLIFDAILVRESLVIVAGLLIVFLMNRARGVAGWASTGVATGASIMLKSHFAPMFIAAILWLLLGPREDSLSRRLRFIGALTVGLFVGLSPMMVRNVVVGVPMLSSPSGAFFTFIGANTPDYRGSGFAMSPEYAPDLIDASHGSLPSAIRLTIASHSSVWSFVNNLWTHFDAAFRWYETPNNTNFYYYRLWAPVLAILPFTYCWIVPAGLLGMLLALPRWREAWALAALVLSNGLVLLMFFVIDRYRAPLLAALLPFAAFAFVTLYRLASAQRWSATAGLACLLIALIAAIARPFESPQPTIRPTDIYVSFHYVFGPRIAAAVEAEIFQRPRRTSTNSSRLCRPRSTVFRPDPTTHDSTHSIRVCCKCIESCSARPLK